MSKQENHSPRIIEELPVDETRQGEVKGGEVGWAQKSVIATIPGTTT
jgi:hypothetical protein